MELAVLRSGRGEKVGMAKHNAASLEALQHAERTSIVRPRRLPIPPSMLQGTGWRDGQPLVARRDGDALVIAADGDGRSLRLAANGLAGTPESFGLRTGQVVEWQAGSRWLRAWAVDGLSHDSYTCPKPDAVGVAVPPSWLIQAFTGNPNVTGYLQSGARTADMLAGLARDAGRDAADLESVLDFGCGVGRVLRFVSAGCKAKLVGYDLHAPSIDWCNTHMAFARWEHGRQAPPIPEPDRSFDLIYAISVLTHLDERHQDMWLSEWQRLVKPGGLLVVTYRSEHFVEQFIRPRAAPRAEAIVNGLRDGNGFTYLADDGWAGIFPAYYSDAYHSAAYVERHWGRFFDVIRLYPAGSMAVRQDVALLRSRA